MIPRAELTGPALGALLRAGGRAGDEARTRIGEALRTAAEGGDGALDRAAADLGASARTVRRWIADDASLVPAGVVLPGPGYRPDPWRLYLLRSAPGDVVATDGAGGLWLVALRPDGWATRRAYRGHRTSLVPVTDDAGMWLAARTAGWPPPDDAGP